MYALVRKTVHRTRSDAGFGMIELVAAMTVMAIGVLAIFAMYHSSMTQTKRASTVTTAAALADTEMENYRAIEYQSIGLDATEVGAADSTYTGQSGGAYLAISSPQNQTNSTVVVTKCPATPCTNSSPTKTAAGADGKSYRVDTYITWKATSNQSGTAGRNGKLVTVVVRDATTLRTYARVSSLFDEATGL